jgi:hypothetical protein
MSPNDHGVGQIPLNKEGQYLKDLEAEIRRHRRVKDPKYIKEQAAKEKADKEKKSKQYAARITEEKEEARLKPSQVERPYWIENVRMPDPMPAADNKSSEAGPSSSSMPVPLPVRRRSPHHHADRSSSKSRGHGKKGSTKKKNDGGKEDNKAKG